VLSLVEIVDEAVVGHIVFTRAGITGSGAEVSAALLAPLAVHPASESRGIRSQQVREGLRRLPEAGVDLVFVLGHPGYYPRFGFTAAGVKGFEAPYPIPQKNADAWMVKVLRGTHAAHSGGRWPVPMPSTIPACGESER
jgi:predicted N-acetyltransferase YhbS